LAFGYRPVATGYRLEAQRASFLRRNIANRCSLIAKNRRTSIGIRSLLPGSDRAEKRFGIVYLENMTGSETSRPGWVGIPVRALLVTFLLTLLSFAVALLLSILGTVVYSQVEHVAPNLPFAYRHIAFPFAIAVGTIVLVVMLVVEIRNYRQRKALAGIERQLSR
jgi:hypothetical protein